MVVQQLVAVLVLSQEGMSTCPLLRHLEREAQYLFLLHYYYARCQMVVFLIKQFLLYYWLFCKENIAISPTIYSFLKKYLFGCIWS